MDSPNLSNAVRCECHTVARQASTGSALFQINLPAADSKTRNYQAFAWSNDELLRQAYYKALNDATQDGAPDAVHILHLVRYATRIELCYSELILGYQQHVCLK